MTGLVAPVRSPAVARSSGGRGSDDLFSAAVDEHLSRSAPLAARLRPRTLDEVVGQAHLLGPDRPLRRLIESDRLSSVILWGPPGTGRPPWPGSWPAPPAGPSSRCQR